MKLPSKPDLAVSLSGSLWVLDPSELVEVGGKKIKGGEFVFALTRALDRAKRLTALQREKMIAYASLLAQLPQPDERIEGSTKAQLASVATASRGLLSALSTLTANARREFSLLAREACFLNPAPVDDTVIKRAAPLLSDERIELLAETWDLVAAVATLANYAESQIEEPQHIRKADVRARHLVATLAIYHHWLTGKFPPKDPAAWFAEFAALVGDYLGHKVGSGIIRSGIELAKNPTDDPEV